MQSWSIWVNLSSKIIYGIHLKSPADKIEANTVYRLCFRKACADRIIPLGHQPIYLRHKIEESCPSVCSYSVCSISCCDMLPSSKAIAVKFCRHLQTNSFGLYKRSAFIVSLQNSFKCTISFTHFERDCSEIFLDCESWHSNLMLLLGAIGNSGAMHDFTPIHRK